MGKARLIYQNEGEWCNVYCGFHERAPVLISTIRRRALEADPEIRIKFDKVNQLVLQVVDDGSYQSLYSQTNYDPKPEPPVFPNDPGNQQEPG